MNRRNFFKVSSIAVGAAAFSGIAGTTLNKVLAATTRPDSSGFSIELVTDDEDKAIRLIESIVNDMNYSGGTVKFSEYRLDRAESADIVLIKNGSLVNYKTGKGDTEKELQEVAQSLGLPKIIQNPVRIKFSASASNNAATSFLVCHKDKIVNKIEAGAKNQNITLRGSRGELVINISGRKARVVQSACTHKNCINSGSISLSGESIVCIPNEVHIIAE